MSEAIHNHYESLLEDEIKVQKLDEQMDADTLADFRCTALNMLPPRYIRYSVDLAYFTSPNEKQSMTERTRRAVDESLRLISQREKE